MKKIYLHIGAGKTGTSALQAQFVLNRENLAKEGYYYPSSNTDGQAKNFYITSGNAVELAILLKDQGNPNSKIKKLMKGYVKEAKGLDIILSSEVLESYNKAHAQMLKKIADDLHYEIIIVYYVRAIADHLISSYHQLIKRHHYSKPFNYMIRNKNHRFLGRIEMSIDIFGKESVLVKNYDKVKDDIFLDFVSSVLNISNTDVFKSINKKVNRSLSKFEVSMMQHMNTFFNKNEESTFISNALIHNNPDIAYTMTIDRNDLEKLKKMYIADVEKINTYLLESEKPFQLIDSLQVLPKEEKAKLNEFQISVLAILAEMTKEMKK